MVSRTSCVRFLCGALLFCTIGCYRPGMYAPYRGFPPPQYNNNYPAMPYGQPQYLPQAQPYPGGMTVPGAMSVPGGVVVPESGGTYVPSIDSGGLEEGWRSGHDSLDSGFGSGGEIAPYDGNLGTSDFGGSDASPGYGIDNGGGMVPQPQDDGMFRQDSAKAPMSVQASAFRQKIPTTSTGSTYGYSGKDYTWLRGIIGFEQREQMHNIIYSLSPDNSDAYGGNLTLRRDQRLQQFRPGDIVEVRGRIDQASTDAHGKPLYVVESVTQVVAPR